ncbi:MAG: hypothetical protein M1820_002038 [Bogoriella megaspora]|nr:MAG: hypothetical protein M1820_002038 [Bogoriella megaspora]
MMILYFKNLNLVVADIGPFRPEDGPSMQPRLMSPWTSFAYSSSLGTCRSGLGSMASMATQPYSGARPDMETSLGFAGQESWAEFLDRVVDINDFNSPSQPSPTVSLYKNLRAVSGADGFAHWVASCDDKLREVFELEAPSTTKQSRRVRFI